MRSISHITYINLNPVINLCCSDWLLLFPWPISVNKTNFMINKLQLFPQNIQGNNCKLSDYHTRYDLNNFIFVSTFLLALDLGGGFSSSLSSEELSSSEELPSSSSSLSLFSTLGAFFGALCLGGALFFWGTSESSDSSSLSSSSSDSSSLSSSLSSSSSSSSESSLSSSESSSKNKQKTC